MKKLLLSALFLSSFAFSQTKTDKMQWFADAKLGIFIHWGIYSVNGIAESWSFFNGYTPYENYIKQLNGFKAENYNPELWTNLIKQSGAKYAVITSKHHDGLALWNTNAGGISIPKNSAAKKDVLTPFVTELKKAGLKTGIYYSLPDWSHHDYDIFTRTEKRYDYKAEPQRFENFLKFYKAQLKEISTLYNPDLYWFDGGWEHSYEEWKSGETRQMLLSKNPNTIINARLDDKGDYETPEQGIPMQTPKADFWELCYTMNDSWGYQPDDRNYKSPNQLIKTLVECIAMGGNLLLDIGPKSDGTIAQEQIDILKKIGRWTLKHQEAVYGTVKGISQQHFSGKSALSKDRKSLFLYLSYTNNGQVWLRGIESEIQNIKMVGAEKSLKFSKKNNDIWVDFPENLADEDVSVIKINFKNEIKTVTPKNIEIAGNSTQQIKQIAYLSSLGKNPFPKGSIKMNSEIKTDIQDSEVKNWIKKHAEVFENSLQPGLSDSRYAGMSTLSADGTTLYLFVDGKTNGNLMIKGLMNNIQRVRIVGDGAILNHKIYDKLFWSSVPGLVTLEIPKHRLDKNMTIVALMLDGPMKEYDKEVKAVESN